MADEEPGTGKLDDVRAEIAREILEVHHESYGTGASSVDVHIADDLVVVIIDIELTAAERTLMGGDQAEAVKGTREAFQHVIAPTFTAIVERSTGRRVTAFLSSMSVEPLYAVELFRLEPHDT
jgi:uncharacterized protein YbcI